MIGNLDVGTAKVISATANIKATQGAILGIWVSSVIGLPTIAVYDSATTTTALPIASTLCSCSGHVLQNPSSIRKWLVCRHWCNSILHN